MFHISAIALTDVEYNGSKGRASAKKDSVISDLSEEECEQLVRLKAVKRISGEQEAAPPAKYTSPFRSKKRGR